MREPAQQRRQALLLAQRGAKLAPPTIRCTRAAAALLEVVLSLSILLIAMSVVGLTFRNGERNVELSDHITRAMMMTDRLVEEIDTNQLKFDAREQWDSFGEEAPPGMSWRVVVNPHEEIRGLLDIDIYIYLGNPDASAEDHQLVLYTRLQRPEPKGIDFEKDFGFDQDQLQVLTDAIPGGSAAFDLTNFDPRTLASMNLDQLVEMLPALVQMFGGNLTGGGQLDAILQAIQKGDMNALQNLAQQALDQSGQQGTGTGTGGGKQGGSTQGGQSTTGGQGSQGGKTSSGGGTTGGGAGSQGKTPPSGGSGGKQPQNPTNRSGGGRK